MHEADLLESGGKLYLDKPTAFAAFPAEIGMQPQKFLNYFYNVRRFTSFPRGGHFAALEQPQALGERVLPHETLH